MNIYQKNTQYDEKGHLICMRGCPALCPPFKITKKTNHWTHTEDGLGRERVFNNQYWEFEERKKK